MSEITHRTAAAAQISISVIFLVGYFAVIFTFLLGYVRADLGWKEAIIALLGVITGSVGTIIAFWFSRQRHTVSEEAGK